MAITMSGATVTTDQRDSLLGQTVDTGIIGGGSGGGFLSGLFGSSATAGAALAGVTPAFASEFSSALEQYKAEVKAKLDQLASVGSNEAFQGSGITSALTTFVDSVREVAQSYLDALSQAEQQIIESVAQAYQTQDQDLSGNMNSDSSTVSGSTAHV